jgi:hypothetical protein
VDSQDPLASLSVMDLALEEGDDGECTRVNLKS